MGFHEAKLIAAPAGTLLYLGCHFQFTGPETPAPASFSSFLSLLPEVMPCPFYHIFSGFSPCPAATSLIVGDSLPWRPLLDLPLYASGRFVFQEHRFCSCHCSPEPSLAPSCPAPYFLHSTRADASAQPEKLFCRLTQLPAVQSTEPRPLVQPSSPSSPKQCSSFHLDMSLPSPTSSRPSFRAASFKMPSSSDCSSSA